ncbi:Xaa-Pro aminopeptidase [Mucinivorans hirudinis]|uniref:Xaa-Pro aminopeptidase n=1 Tax=Mucinivorans hirudinis TaxID=1433126 RepID=A0A060R9E8_9BACT|nr:Xaa-Pro aminopeptidase [Mucinivorans hirudinis]
MKLTNFRTFLAENHLDAFVVPSADPHQSEYTATHWGCRAWLSGFDGSAGTAVITADKAALWTDSRYFLQAQMQLSKDWILQKVGLKETPTIEEWLVANTAKGARVGIDGRLFTKTQFDNMRESLIDRELICTDDPFATIWAERAPLPDCKAFILDEEYSGESAVSKIARLKPAKGVLLVSALDDIAWLLNIRGSDISYNPLVMSYAAIECSGRVNLFADKNKFSREDVKGLEDSGVVFYRYEDWFSYLGTLECALVNVARLDYLSYSLLKNVEQGGAAAINEAKAIKNSAELEGFRRAMIEDGVALVGWMMWLEKANRPTEYEAAIKLRECRMHSPLCKGESFSSIVAYRANGAIVHYSPAADGSAVIEREGFLLVDSGGQYLCGTTDITRTYCLGEPTAAQRRDYTNVLMGVIDISRAIFPEGTRGTQLDVLARQHLWRSGYNFLHGTGHGVGHFLCVHEGPQSIRMNENPVTLRVGMVNSIEPAVYRTGEYGIRIENLVAVTAAQYDGYEQFETLTLSPICTKAVESSMLESHHRAWLNDYNRMVYNRLSPYLDGDQQQWLAYQCREV